MDEKKVIDIRQLPSCPFCNGTSLDIHADYMIQCESCKTVFMQPQVRDRRKQKSMLEVWCNRPDKQDKGTVNHEE